MTPELLVLFGSIVGGTGALLSYWAGWRDRRCLEADWRRPTGEPPLRLRRSGDGYGSGPTTPKPDIIPKPQFPPPQIIREDFLP
jgi:hypothetical protein